MGGGGGGGGGKLGLALAARLSVGINFSSGFID